jgi:hypothetical protein
MSSDSMAMTCLPLNNCMISEDDDRSVWKYDVSEIMIWMITWWILIGYS